MGHGGSQVPLEGQMPTFTMDGGKAPSLAWWTLAFLQDKALGFKLGLCIVS